MLTPEGGIPILYKDQDRGWFLMVLRVFAWIMATGVGGWLIFYKSSRSIQPAIGVFILLMLIVRQTVEASHSVEIHPDGMIVDGRFFSAEDVGDNWPELQMKDDDPSHGHLRYLRHAPDDDRRLLELKGVGKSNRETADALRRSASAVEQRLYLLRDRARRES